MAHTIHSVISFSHRDGGGTDHALSVSAEYRAGDTHYANPIFTDGIALCSCKEGSHFIRGGCVCIATEESLNLKVRHEAGSLVI